MFEAKFYKKLEENRVRCNLCNRNCVIPESGRGQCGVRKNIKGKLYSLVYGKTLTLTIDPIEKKPLFHFKPGTYCVGVSTQGCNFFCQYCQNWSISQERSEEAIEGIPFTSPQQIVDRTLDEGVEGIAYTYTEPTVFAEYALDTMKIAKKKGLYNVWVSNGYMSKECIDAIAPFLDAINVDFKGNERFYQELVGNAHAKFVKENISYFHEKKVHVEVTNLVIPGWNDSKKEFKEVGEFIHSIDESIPLHFSRFFPCYKMTHLPITDTEKLRKAKKVAEKIGLKYVYIGNVPEEESTLCHKCGNELIKRIAFSSTLVGLDAKGKCKKCGTVAKIIL